MECYTNHTIEACEIRGGGASKGNFLEAAGFLLSFGF